MNAIEFTSHKIYTFITQLHYTFLHYTFSFSFTFSFITQFGSAIELDDGDDNGTGVLVQLSPQNLILVHLLFKQ